MKYKNQYAYSFDKELPDVLIDIFKKHGIDLIPSCYGIGEVTEHILNVPREGAA